MSPTFSVATPTRNALHQLRRCVGSVRGQQGVDVEHLVQDALSTDGTGAWLQEQGLTGARSEADAGMYDAIARAWGRAGGRYLSWLNADEQYLPGTLAFVQQYFEAHPQIDVLSGDYIVTSASGQPIATRREIPFRKAYVLNGFLYTYSCTLFFRRELFDRGWLTFDPGLRYAADLDLLMRLHGHGARFGHANRYFSLFGIDGNNLSTHPRMAAEHLAMQQRYGALKNPWLRRLVAGGRRIERVLRGYYMSQAVSYSYACDEGPTYERRKDAKVGGTYSLADGRVE